MGLSNQAIDQGRARRTSLTFARRQHINGMAGKLTSTAAEVAFADLAKLNSPLNLLLHCPILSSLTGNASARVLVQCSAKFWSIAPIFVHFAEAMAAIRLYYSSNGHRQLPDHKPVLDRGYSALTARLIDRYR